MLKIDDDDDKNMVKKEVTTDNTTTDTDSEAASEDDLNWWEQKNITFATKGEKRWDTLSHNGVLFPPLYVPHGIPLYYDGKEFKMTPEEEEVATMFAVMKEHDYYHNETFRRNFFNSWREILDKRPHPIRRLELCNFEPIYQWHLKEREKKLERTKEEKKKAKLEADAASEPYRWCFWNGRKEQVANFRIEPPGLFRGRGNHPLMGKLKQRVAPEDITINIDSKSEVPVPPAGHQWKAVQHDNTVTWLAMWRDNVGGNFKYVMLAPSSTVKGQSDMLKFEKARKLKHHIEAIRESYLRGFKSSDLHVAQRAVAMYFIDKLALRVGNEKGADEADTVGCCSLRVEHLQLKPGNIVKFDFLGKDSIRYQNEVKILPEAYALLSKFIYKKRRGDDVFDRLTPTQLNDNLKSFMHDLSAKVFRTYNASITLERWFKEKPVNEKATVADKLAYFNKANTEVAILCNHQRTVSKSYLNQITQLTTKSSYTKAILEQLEKARDDSQKKSHEVIVREFFEVMDRMQYAWLNMYGTEDQKKEYAELVASRSKPKEASSSRKKKSESSSAVSKKKTSKKTKSTKKNGKRKDKKTAKAKKPSSKKAPLSSTRAGKKGNTNATQAIKKKGVKTRVSKKPSSMIKEESDDDIPLSAL